MFLLSVVLSSALAFDLDAVKAEANADRRAELAADHGHTALDKAKAQYKESQYGPSLATMKEVQASVEIAAQALREGGKDFRKNSKQVKKVEQRIQLLIRRVKSFEQEVSVEDRPGIQKVRERLEDINDEIVLGIFSKHK